MVNYELNVLLLSLHAEDVEKIETREYFLRGLK